MKFVLGGIIVLIAAIMLLPQLHLQFNLLGALLIVAFGFLFVTVSSRLTGEIGSSSNPISGMTVATLLLTCFIFLIIGWTGPGYYVTALSIGAIVCIAASNGGTTSQDLKTGFLVGATPWRQQIAILVGAGASALILGPILISLNGAATVYVPASKLQLPAEVRADVSRLGPATETVPADQGISDTKQYHAWYKVDEKDAKAGKYLVDDAGAPVYFVDPGINGTAQGDRGRARGGEVRRAEGDADELHHQGHPQPRAAVGARPARRDDRGRAGDGGHPFARLRGGRLPAALLVVAHLRRRAWCAGWWTSTCADGSRTGT